jgi:succinate semialdehyde reductase (NADPH)
MKAAVLQSVGSPLVLEDLPIPRPRAEEVLVKVAACGVCHSDLHVAKGELKFPVPCVLGHEISGVVEETTRPRRDIGPRQPHPLINPIGNSSGQTSSRAVV